MRLFTLRDILAALAPHGDAKSQRQRAREEMFPLLSVTRLEERRLLNAAPVAVAHTSTKDNATVSSPGSDKGGQPSVENMANAMHRGPAYGSFTAEMHTATDHSPQHNGAGHNNHSTSTETTPGNTVPATTNSVNASSANSGNGNSGNSNSGNANAALTLGNFLPPPPLDDMAANSPPQGTNNTVATLEDTPYTFTAADFGYSDPGDSPPNNFLAVKVTTLPGAGTLFDNGAAVSAGDFVSVSDINAGKFTFAPAANANGAPYTSFTFQVQDDGGTANNGVDLDQTARTMTVKVTAVNDPPVNTLPAGPLFTNTNTPLVISGVSINDIDALPSSSMTVLISASHGKLAVDGFPPGAFVTNNGTSSIKLTGTISRINQTLSKVTELTFTPDANYVGPAIITISTNDGGATGIGGAMTTVNTLQVNVGSNHPPVGADNTVTTLEDHNYTFTTADFGFSDPNDSPANAFLNVIVTTLPGAGTLYDNGVAVVGGNAVSVSDIMAGKLVFTPTANANGAPYSSFTFQVQDDGGTAYGGVDTDPTARTMTIDVTSVNDAPIGADNTVTTLEDHNYTFTAADFGFSDPNDNPANALQNVIITTLPGAGTLYDNGVAVAGGIAVSVSDISAGKLVFTPAANASGNPYASFTFQVQDDGGTGNGGIDTDQTARTMTIDVTSVNDAPIGTDNTVTTLEDHNYTFTTADFGFSDPNDNPANAFLNVIVTTLPGAGTLYDNGVAVMAGNSVSVSDIMAGNLVFTPTANANGTPYSSFTFQVQDDGGTANGGIDTDQTARTMTIDVTSVNDAPIGADNTVTTLEDHSYTFTTADFGFTDPNDNPANAFLNVIITTLPGAGTLYDNGVAVMTGNSVSVSDIMAGNLVFTPVGNANGNPYASFTFQVQDDGGTANGGIDTDQIARTMTIDVTSVNDAPVGADNTVTTLEDHNYTFTAADFGFSDPNDNPANAFLNVIITTLPGAGTLYDNGVTVGMNQSVSVSDIMAGNLVFTPVGNANGNPYASFTFQVQDDGGTANGGIDTDPTARTMTIDVTSVNDAPVGADNTVTTLEDHNYTFTTADFGFSDPNDNPANAFLNVIITTLPGAGTLYDNGVAVGMNQSVSVTGIMAGNLVFTPVGNANGNPYASFTFQVQDDGGTANGGIDTDPTARTMTIDVTSVNDAPIGADNTVTTLEDHNYVFTTADFGFSDPNDNPANAFLNVIITTLPGAGTLYDNGVAVVGGNAVSVSDITAGKLVFTPATNANSNLAPYTSFTFQVQDDGGTANGGIDTDPTARTMTIDVTPVNDAPIGADNTVTTLEDHSYTFTTADFGFSDPNDSEPPSSIPPNNLLNVIITTLPGVGTLYDNGVAVLAGDAVSVSDIMAGNLVFTPATNANSNVTPYASFTFQVQDDGGTANGGIDTDPTARTMTIDVTPVNDAPMGADNTLTTLEDHSYTFTTADFGFSDPNDSEPPSSIPPNNLLNVIITTLPGAGTLYDNGVAVVAGNSVSVSDIMAGKLIFTPATNANSNVTPYASFTFQVQDDGGTANGGIDTDPTARTMTIDVTPVNDAPLGTDNTVTVLEDNPYVFTEASFGFSDPNDSSPPSSIPANTLLAVKITTLPGAGTLTDNGAAVAQGDFVSVSDIDAGKLVFTPAANANSNGAAYASFTFQVQDTGGTLNGGIDLDPNAKTFTIDVTPVNDAPMGADKTVTTLEDHNYTFTTADFGFSDPNDSEPPSSIPPNNLLNVIITTLPGAGTLYDNGVAVVAGDSVSVSDIMAGKLIFTPATNANSNVTPYATFTFQVQDDGGTANGGIDIDPTARTMTIDVTPVNDAPMGADKTVIFTEDDGYQFTAADFGFSDPNDSEPPSSVPPNNFLNVIITSVPVDGTLYDHGSAVNAGGSVSVADINAGWLTYDSTGHIFGDNQPHPSFTFQVQDDGGTANGGIDTDQTARTMTLNVQGVVHQPTLLVNSATGYNGQDIPLVFKATGDSNKPNETISYVVTGVPNGALLLLGGAPVVANGNEYDFTSNDIDNLTLTLAMPISSSEALVQLTVTAIGIDVAPDIASGNTQATTTNTLDFHPVNPILNLTVTPAVPTPDNSVTIATSAVVTFTLAYTPPRDYTVTVDWGDPRPNLPPGVDPSTITVSKTTGAADFTSFTSLEHTYSDNVTPNTGNSDPASLRTNPITLSFHEVGTGVGTAQTSVKVQDVDPTLKTYTTTDADSDGNVTITGTISHVGTSPLFLQVDWGPGDSQVITDQTPMPGVTFSTQVINNQVQGTFTVHHQYLAPPDPANPAAVIPIKVTVLDDTGLNAGGTQTAQAPGLGHTIFFISEAPELVPIFQPVLERDEIVLAAPNVLAFTSIPFDMHGQEADNVTNAQAVVALRTIDPNTGLEKTAVVLPVDVLNNLPSLFARMPDDHYRLYYVEQGTQRLISDVVVRRGKPIDPSDESEGTQDRPPTSHQQLDMNDRIGPAPAEAEEEGPAANDGADASDPIVEPSTAWKAIAPAVLPTAQVLVPLPVSSSATVTVERPTEGRHRQLFAPALATMAAAAAWRQGSWAAQVDQELARIQPHALSKSARLLRRMQKRRTADPSPGDRG